MPVKCEASQPDHMNISHRLQCSQRGRRPPGTHNVIEATYRRAAGQSFVAANVICFFARVARPPNETAL